MTTKTTKKPAAVAAPVAAANRKRCEICHKRPVPSRERRIEAGMSTDMIYCIPCFDEAGWENTHSDHAHAEIDTLTTANTNIKDKAELDAYLVEIRQEMAECWVCHPEINKALEGYTAKEGHHSPRRKQINHRACQHPQTAQARRQCRNLYWLTGKLLVSDATTPAAALKAPYAPQKGDEVVYTTKGGKPRTGIVASISWPAKGRTPENTLVKVRTPKGGYVTVTANLVTEASN